MKIAFYKARYGKLVDYIISIFTFSKYSHCEIVFSDGECASSSPRDGGVRFKKIELGHKWDVYTLVTHDNEDAVRQWFTDHDHQGYDLLGAIGSGVGLNWTSIDKKYCSYCCASALGMQNPVLSPGRLFSLLRRNGYIQ